MGSGRRIFNTHFKKRLFKESVHHSWVSSEMCSFVQKVRYLIVRFQKWSHTAGSQGHGGHRDA